ncbi:MAG: carboxypeptidase-like regulatory domain-containing protein, partial [Terracidiphilus sp.]
MNRPFWRSVVLRGLLALAVLTGCLPAMAQQTLGSLNGTVVDPSGAAVSGAAVSVTNTATNITAKAQTQKTGFFQIFNLPIGTYSVKVSHD